VVEDQGSTPTEVPPAISHAPVPSRTATQLYNDELATRILDHYIEGMSLRAICKLPEMPGYSTVLKWVKDNPEFKREFEGARVARAIAYEDEIISIAESAQFLEKDQIPGSRLSFDAYNRLAEANDQSRFGKKTTVSGDGKAPITFIINTGFPGDLNEHQRQPELGIDGLIKRKADAAQEVASQIIETVLAEQEDTDGNAAPAEEEIESAE
jgi:hypothetical protein